MSVSTNIVRMGKGRTIVIRSDGSIDFKLTLTSKYASMWHRPVGPAVIRADGTIKYVRLGIITREDGPAVRFSFGAVRYSVNGVWMTPTEYFAKCGVL